MLKRNWSDMLKVLVDSPFALLYTWQRCRTHDNSQFNAFDLNCSNVYALYITTTSILPGIQSCVKKITSTNNTTSDFKLSSFFCGGGGGGCSRNITLCLCIIFQALCVHLCWWDTSQEMIAIIRLCVSMHIVIYIAFVFERFLALFYWIVDVLL